MNKKYKEQIQKEVISELQKYIDYVSPDFQRLPQEFQDILVNAFVSGFTAKAKLSYNNRKSL